MKPKEYTYNKMNCPDCKNRMLLKACIELNDDDERNVKFYWYCVNCCSNHLQHRYYVNNLVVFDTLEKLITDDFYK